MQQFPMNGMMIRRSVALAAGVPPESEVGHHTDLHFAVRYALTATRPFLVIADEVSAYRFSAQSIARPHRFELDGHLNYDTLARLEPRNALERRAKRHALDGAAGRAVLALVARGERRRALDVFLRHGLRMQVPRATRLKLCIILVGSLLGVRWPQDVLQRRRLGLPDPRRLFTVGRTS
jgi:hypothetical protein